MPRECTGFGQALLFVVQRHSAVTLLRVISEGRDVIDVCLLNCRDTAAEVLKEEVAMLRRSDARGSVDVDYVKNVVLNGFESGELSSDSSMLPVLARLLHFSSSELQRIKTSKPAAMKRTLSRTFLNKLTS